MIHTIRCDGTQALAAATIERLVDPDDAPRTVAISGGATYAGLFPYWAAVRRLAAISFYPADERLVPIDDPASNWGMARRTLFDPLGNAASLAHFVVSATAYRQLLRTEVGDPPVFDAVFLGVGDDGHTASLFPGGAELTNVRDVVLETVSPTPPVRRVTVGLSVLWAARSLVAVVTGEHKRAIVGRILDGDRGLPATLALTGHPAPHLILERSADPTQS